MPGKVKMKETLGERIKRTSMDAAYSAAKAVEGSFGPQVRDLADHGTGYITEMLRKGSAQRAAEEVIRRSNDVEEYGGDTNTYHATPREEQP